MHKQTFRKQIVFSSILTAIAIVPIVVFCACMIKRYSPPNENNTSTMSDTVTEVYYTAPGERVVVIALLDKEPLKLVSPYTLNNLYSTIGYDIDELANLLEGKDIEYRRMNDLPWAIEIYVGDTKIDNTKLTTQQMYFTRVGIVIVGLIMLAFAVCGDIVYLKSRHHTYQKAERKRIKRAKRDSKLKVKETNK